MDYSHWSRIAFYKKTSEKIYLLFYHRDLLSQQLFVRLFRIHYAVWDAFAFGGRRLLVLHFSHRLRFNKDVLRKCWVSSNVQGVTLWILQVLYPYS